MQEIDKMPTNATSIITALNPFSISAIASAIEITSPAIILSIG
jgi:hypothetical protein